jgi:hypothetical protein
MILIALWHLAPVVPVYGFNAGKKEMKSVASRRVVTFLNKALTSEKKERSESERMQ